MLPYQYLDASMGQSHTDEPVRSRSHAVCQSLVIAEMFLLQFSIYSAHLG